MGREREANRNGFSTLVSRRGARTAASVTGSAPNPLTEQRDLVELVGLLVEQSRVALDTEFHRERTYYPQVALLQFAWDGGLALVDPLAVDLTPLAAAFESDSLWVMHAARQDLEVLDRCVGTVPRRLFDTQLAGGFVGYTTPSLASLVERELGVTVPKGDRLTDWLRRPLTDAQLVYAASDVEHLLAVHDILAARLADKGRTDWFDEAMSEVMAEPRGPRDPADAWRRIKEARHLKGEDLAVAQAVAEWRERRAADVDVTPRYVLSDLAIVGIAAARPTNSEELRGVRGVDSRSFKAAVADELFATIRSAAGSRPRGNTAVPPAELPAELRPALPLIAAWVTQLSRTLSIEAALLATRADLESFLRGDPSARIAHGWREKAVGRPIRRLLAGDAALAFDRAQGLVLEPRRSARE